MNCKQEYQTINQLIIQQFHHPINQTRLIECPFYVIRNLIEHLVEVTTGIPIIAAICVPGYSISAVTGHALGGGVRFPAGAVIFLLTITVPNTGAPQSFIKFQRGPFRGGGWRWKLEADLLTPSVVGFKIKRTILVLRRLL